MLENKLHIRSLLGALLAGSGERGALGLSAHTHVSLSQLQTTRVGGGYGDDKGDGG